MKKPLIGSETSTPATRPKNHLPRSLSRWRIGDRPPGFVGSGTRVPMTRLPAPFSSAAYICGRIDFVVLEVAVDDGDVVGAGGEPALDHGAGEAGAVDAAQAAHPRIVTGDGEGDVVGAVGGIVVDDDHFPGQAVERRHQPLEQPRHVGGFAVGRHDDGKRRAGRRRRSGHGSLESSYSGKPYVAAGKGKVNAGGSAVAPSAKASKALKKSSR